MRLDKFHELDVGLRLSHHALYAEYVLTYYIFSASSVSICLVLDFLNALCGPCTQVTAEMEVHVSVLQPALLLGNDSPMDTETIGCFFHKFHPSLAYEEDIISGTI